MPPTSSKLRRPNSIRANLTRGLPLVLVGVFVCGIFFMFSGDAKSATSRLRVGLAGGSGSALHGTEEIAQLRSDIDKFKEASATWKTSNAKNAAVAQQVDAEPSSSSITALKLART